MSALKGHVDSLDHKVQNVWEALGRTGEQYVLVGGTALAWHLGHRVSYDIDIATSGPVEHPRTLRKRWNHEGIGKHKRVRVSPDHYTKFFATDMAPKIDIHGKVHTACLDAPTFASTGLRIASLTDILKQKLVAMSVRMEKRDGQDVAAILKDGRANVELAIRGLRNTTGTGIGPDETETLARLLGDLSATPWKEFPILKEVAPRLLSAQDVPLEPFCDEIQGPKDLRRIHGHTPTLC